jgi:hypothetical protein
MAVVVGNVYRMVDELVDPVIVSNSCHLSSFVYEKSRRILIAGLLNAEIKAPRIGLTASAMRGVFINRRNVIVSSLLKV